MCDEPAYRMRLSLNEEINFLNACADELENTIRATGDINVDRLHKVIDALRRSIDRARKDVDDLNRYHKELEKNAEPKRTS